MGLVQFVEKTDGADKVLRVACYFGKIVLAFVAKGGYGYRALANLIASFSETRVVLRLFGIPQTLMYAANLNIHDKNVNYHLLQIMSLLVYYPMEHVYYAAEKGVLNVAPSYAAVLSKWSCRAWLLYIIIDAYLLYEAWTKESPNGGAHGPATCIKEKDLFGSPINRTRYKAKREVVKALGIVGDFVLALNWSLDRAIMDEGLIGLFGTISSVCGIILKQEDYFRE